MKKLSITIAHTPLQDVYFDGDLPSREEFNQHVMYLAIGFMAKLDHPCVGCATIELEEMTHKFEDVDDGDESLRQEALFIAMCACGLWVMANGRTIDIDQPIAINLSDLEDKHAQNLHDLQSKGEHVH